MKLKMQAGSGVPVGAYQAKFAGVEMVPADPLRGYGEGLKWLFEVTAGPQAGQKTSRITTAKPTLKNACGKMLAGVVGRALAEGEDVDLGTLIGKAYVIVVSQGEGGGTRVESLAPAQ